MDIQNNNVSIQINAKDLSGKQLRVADCDVFIIHVFTDDPKFYLTFSKRDMLMTEWIDELVIPKHQMEQLQSGVVQYTYHYLPIAHDCKFEAPEFCTKCDEDDAIEMTGAYHPHKHHGHGREELINSKPVVTSIYWRNIKHPHPVHPVNSVTLFDIERLHKLIENERVLREKDFETLENKFGEEFDSKLVAEIERSIAEDEKVNSEIEVIKNAIENLGKEAEDKNSKFDEDITSNSTGLTAEIDRATKKEIELEQLIQGEVSRAKSAEEVLDTKVSMEKDRAQANESNINDRLVSLTDRFEAHKELANETIKSEIERAKSVESSLNERINGVVKDLADEVSRAAQKDIEHSNLVETESNRAKAVENKISVDLDTEISRAKDSEKHILDEVHTLQDNVSNLATADNVYKKPEVDKKISDVRNDVSTLENWVGNHTNDVSALNVKINSIVGDVDKIKSDVLAEIAKCDAENGKLSTEIQTLSDSIYSKAEVDGKVSIIDSSISEVKNWISNHTDNTSELNDKVSNIVADLEKVITDINTEATERINADLLINTKLDITDGKLNVETERAKSSEKLISDNFEDFKTLANSKHSDIETAIAEVNAALNLEIARAKAGEKVNADAISIITADASTAGSIKKSLSDAKDYTDIELAKLSLSKDVELADTLKVYATNSDVDKKISDVIGTAPDALDTLGKISNALSQDSDAISAINGVLSGKANSDDVYSKAEVDTQINSVINSVTTLETKSENADATINSRIDDVVTKITNIELNSVADASAFANALADEINRAKSADKANSDKITDEAEKLNAKISDVNATLIADIASSTAKDTELEAKIDANSAAISSETARAKQVETELNEKINTINVNAINSSISGLDTKIDNAQATLQTNLDNEISKLNSAFEIHKTEADAKYISVESLEAEINRAKQAENEIKDSIQNVSDIVENAIEELNNLFDSSTGTGSGSLITGGNLDEVLDNYYTKEEVNDLIINTSNEILSNENFLKYQQLTADEYAELEEAGEINENILYIII